jgi:hypothetical protein
MRLDMKRFNSSLQNVHSKISYVLHEKNAKNIHAVVIINLLEFQCPFSANNTSEGSNNCVKCNNCVVQ